MLKVVHLWGSCRYTCSCLIALLAISLLTVRIAHGQPDGLMSKAYSIVPDPTEFEPVWIQSWQLDMTRGRLTITLSTGVVVSKMNPTAVTLLSSSSSQSGVTSYKLSPYTIVTGSGRVVIIDLTANGSHDLNRIKLLPPLATSSATSFLSTDQDFGVDLVNKRLISMPQAQPMPVSDFVPDAIAPQLIDSLLDMNTGTFTLWFSEAIDPTSIDLSRLHLRHSGLPVPSDPADYQFSTVAQGGDTSYTATFDQVQITMSDDDLDRLKLRLPTTGHSLSSTFLNLHPLFCQDMVGFDLSSSSSSYLEISRYQADVISPSLMYFWLNLHTWSLTLTFSEALNLDSFDVTQITLWYIPHSGSSSPTSSVTLQASSSVIRMTTSEVFRSDPKNLRVVEVEISEEDQIKIAADLSLLSPQTLYVSMLELVAADTFDLPMTAVPQTSPMQALQVISTYVESFRLDMTEQTITLSFSAPVIPSTILSAGRIGLRNTDLSIEDAGDQGFEVQEYWFAGSHSVSTFLDPQTCVLYLSSEDFDAVSLTDNMAISADTTFLLLDMHFLRDATGQVVHPFVSPVRTSASAALMNRKAILKADYFIPDLLPPRLMAYDLNVLQRTLRLFFTETIQIGTYFSASSVELQSGPSQSPSATFRLTSATQISAVATTVIGPSTQFAVFSSSAQLPHGGRAVELLLGEQDMRGMLNQDIATDRTKTYLTIAATATKDLSSNPLLPITRISAKNVRVYVGEASRPSLTDVKLDLNAGELTLGFSKAMKPSSFAIESLVLSIFPRALLTATPAPSPASILAYATAHQYQLSAVSSRVQEISADQKQLKVIIGGRDLNSLKVLTQRSPIFFLSSMVTGQAPEGRFMTDIAGNALALPLVSPSQKIAATIPEALGYQIPSINFIPDTTAPELVSFSLSNLPQPLHSSVPFRVTLTFSEAVSAVDARIENIILSSMSSLLPLFADMDTVGLGASERAQWIDERHFHIPSLAVLEGESGLIADTLVIQDDLDVISIFLPTAHYQDFQRKPLVCKTAENCFIQVAPGFIVDYGGNSLRPILDSSILMPLAPFVFPFGSPSHSSSLANYQSPSDYSMFQSGSDSNPLPGVIGPSIPLAVAEYDSDTAMPILTAVYFASLPLSDDAEFNSATTTPPTFCAPSNSQVCLQTHQTPTSQIVALLQERRSDQDVRHKIKAQDTSSTAVVRLIFSEPMQRQTLSLSSVPLSAATWLIVSSSSPSSILDLPLSKSYFQSRPVVAVHWNWNDKEVVIFLGQSSSSPLASQGNSESVWFDVSLLNLQQQHPGQQMSARLVTSSTSVSLPLLPPIARDSSWNPVAPLQSLLGTSFSYLETSTPDCSPCPDGTFLAAYCTAVQDRQCRPCTVCGEGTYRTVECSQELDTVCAVKLPFNSHCEPGCTNCRHEQYESSPCLPTQDRRCEYCRQCLKTEFETSPCGFVADGGLSRLNRECKSCNSCYLTNAETEICDNVRSAVLWRRLHCCRLFPVSASSNKRSSSTSTTTGISSSAGVNSISSSASSNNGASNSGDVWVECNQRPFLEVDISRQKFWEEFLFCEDGYRWSTSRRACIPSKLSSRYAR